MKKIISIMMAVLMVLSMFCVANAALFETDVKTDIAIKLNSDSDYSTSIQKTYENATDIPNVDVKATLDMSAVRSIAKNVAVLEKTNFETLKANGWVTADITVTINYPDGLSVNSLVWDGAATGAETGADTTIYKEVGTRDLTQNPIVIKLEAKEKLADLYADAILETPVLLGDISLIAENIDISDFGTYVFDGTVKCDTKIYNTEADLDSGIAYKEYTFNSVQDTATGKPDNLTVGKISATAKFTEKSSTPSSSVGVGGGSSVVKVTVKASEPSGEVPAGTKVKLTATPTTAKIYYTTDGTEPSVTNGKLDGTTKLYSDELTITEDTTVKAIAVSSNGKTKSSVETWNYTVTGVDVSINPKSGVVKAGTEATISTKNGKDIYYTVDGTEPALDENGAPVGTTQKYAEAIAITEDTTIKAIAVNEEGVVSVVASETYTIAPELTGEHIAYIQGYPDGEVKPDAPITRAEVAKIFSRLTVKKMDIDTEAVASFSDISADAWYAEAVAFMEQEGIVNGYEDGTFKPDNYITRAEFAAMASRFDNLEDINENIFDDVTSNHWAFFEVNSASKKGWVNGYEDGSFRPDNRITRAEAVTIINRMTGRQAKAEFENADLTGFIIFPDAENINMHWAFYDIVEASNDHDYE